MSISLAQAQSVKEFENQRKRALERLETANKMLNETKQSQRSTMNRLNIISRSIKERNALINSINQEINALDLEMEKLNKEKAEMEKKLVLLKADYTRMIREAQVYQSFQSKFMFVMSANSFQQTFRRMRYLQEFTAYQKEQVIKIQEVSNSISLKSDSLSIYKNRQISVAQQKTSEAHKLTNDEKAQRNIYNDLTKKEKELQKEAKAQQKRANDLNNRIEKLIAEEIRKAEAKRKAEEAKKLAEQKKSTQAKPGESTTPAKPSTPPAASTPSSKTSVLTKEETLIAGNFQKNQGRLPWPTERGFISGHFGVQQHPVLTHVTINNKGIYIQTPANTIARAVFEGVVTQRFSIPGSNNTVIVQHGNYRTIYANLTDIYVEVGQKVTAKQNIGKIFTDHEDDNKTELYFQIRKETVILNPEVWITR